MVEFLLILMLIAGEEQEFLNGIVAIVNTDVITYRDIEIFAGIKKLEGHELDREYILNQLIEESIVFQSASEQGIEPVDEVINQCVQDLNKMVEQKGENKFLQSSEYNERDGQKRCLRRETMRLFIENKFLKPVIIGSSGSSEITLDEYKKIAIEDYKNWLSDVIKKFKIEKITENLIVQEAL